MYSPGWSDAYRSRHDCCPSVKSTRTDQFAECALCNRRTPTGNLCGSRYRHIIQLHSSSGAIQCKSEYYLAALMPFILALASDESLQAAEGIYHAIEEVCGW